MVAGVKALAEGWQYDARLDRLSRAPSCATGRSPSRTISARAGSSFDFAAAFGCPVKIINDAAMQALGSYEGGKMLFLGLRHRARLGADRRRHRRADGARRICRTRRRPSRTTSASAGSSALGKKKWRKHVDDVVERLRAALQPDDVVLGGGNADNLKELPPGCRLGDNANAFVGGFRLWATAGAQSRQARSHARQARTRSAHAKSAK